MKRFISTTIFASCIGLGLAGCSPMTSANIALGALAFNETAAAIGSFFPTPPTQVVVTNNDPPAPQAAILVLSCPAGTHQSADPVGCVANPVPVLNPWDQAKADRSLGCRHGTHAVDGRCMTMDQARWLAEGGNQQMGMGNNPTVPPIGATGETLAYAKPREGQTVDARCPSALLNGNGTCAPLPSTSRTNEMLAGMGATNLASNNSAPDSSPANPANGYHWVGSEMVPNGQ